MTARDGVPETILERPLIAFGRGVCGDLDAGLRREWLLANGLGGYAMGTLAGVSTRRYHGWLTAALTPPVRRTVVVGGLDEWLVAGERRTPLSSFEFADGTQAPDGWRHLESFRLEGTLPVWRYAIGERIIERHAWMVHGENTTLVRYTLVRGAAARLEVTPLLAWRDHHSLQSPGGDPSDVSALTRGLRVVTPVPGLVISVSASAGAFMPDAAWWWGFHHREETARGQDDRSDLFAPGRFALDLHPGRPVDLVLTAETASRATGHGLAVEQARQRGLLDLAGVLDAPAHIQQLVLAADQFLVTRELPTGERVPTIIAGYPWFTDWGRDTFIALPGLLLATGRGSEAAGVLRAYAGFVRDGLVPNTFPDGGGDPEHDTVDASLWYVLAAAAYAHETGDLELGRELLPVFKEIIEAHVHGTRHGIGLDHGDGLLRQGEPGRALTWMDARVDEVGITPRIGKPVEIQALWYDALCVVAALCADSGDTETDALYAIADQALHAFRKRFIRGDGSLRDVVDGPDGDDDRGRPNQVLAASLPYPLLNGQAAERMLTLVADRLATSLGLRTLDPADPGYRDTYAGDPATRDAGYHQGPAWPWLMGPYLDALLRVTGDADLVRSWLTPFADHLADAGLGTISELTDGAPPHRPRGAIAQAWSVGEVLRAWWLVDPWRGPAAQRSANRPK